MGEMQVPSSQRAVLDWNYDRRQPRLRALYETARQAQWDVDADLDWRTEVEFGSALPDDSLFARASFEASPVARGGRPMWDRYRWEVQSWMVSQFLHGEQGALVVAGRLVETAPRLDAKLYAASQAADEARHVDAFSRYLAEKVPDPYPVNASLETLLRDVLADSAWDVTALGMQIIVEALAMAAFRLAGNTFHDDLIKNIARLVARDEARHMSFGVLSLGEVYRELTAAERAHREDLVLEAAVLMRRRFLLEDVWRRLDVDVAAGVRYATVDPLMVRYRQTVFGRVVLALDRIGLLTGRVLTGLDQLGLLSAATRERGGPR